jgi:hypothetical protein
MQCIIPSGLPVVPESIRSTCMLQWSAGYGMKSTVSLTYRPKYIDLLTWLPTARKIETDIMQESQMLLEFISFINTVTIGSHDREFIDAVRQNGEPSQS